MQIVIVVLVLLFFVLLLGPIVGATLYYKTHKGEILHINQNRIKDPRYFGKAFAVLVEKSLASAEGNTIQLSRPEPFVDGDTATSYPPAVQELVICREKNFVAPAGITEFQKEIYGAKNIVLNRGTMEIRASYSHENTVIGNGTTVSRWVDAAGTLAVYDHCDLGISATSKTRMSIGVNCRFRRLFAPEICLGQHPGSIGDATLGKDPRIYLLPVQNNKKRNVKYINKEMINEEGIANFSVLSWKNIIVLETVIVQGDVRSHKGVMLCDNAVICGNVFAEQDVHLGKNACILGNVFSQGSIFLEEGAVIGQQGHICSAIAREDVVFEGKNFVFGYVSCEKNGLVAPDHAPRETIHAQSVAAGPVAFLETTALCPSLTFASVTEFTHVDQQGFRFQTHLRDVTLPDGVQKIPRSMFFGCSQLEKAVFPSTVSVMREYAFADCRALREIPGFAQTSLKGLRTSAFENCASLEEISLPATVKFLEGAVFGGCSRLQRVNFARGSQLRAVGDHAFRGCSSLEALRFPPGTQYIGVSAFASCTQLKCIQIPPACQNSPGILECPPEIVQVYAVPPAAGTAPSAPVAAAPVPRTENKTETEHSTR